MTPRSKLEEAVDDLNDDMRGLAQFAARLNERGWYWLVRIDLPRDVQTVNLGKNERDAVIGIEAITEWQREMGGLR